MDLVLKIDDERDQFEFQKDGLSDGDNFDEELDEIIKHTLSARNMGKMKEELE